MSKDKKKGIILVGGTGFLTILGSWLFLQREIGTFSNDQLAEDILHLFGFYQGLYVVPLIIYLKIGTKNLQKV
ncbi:hypothetical protein [Bacillus sp. FJAT-27245]|uniref:hypothetical protein n=1 Tax=Bacillus sp. FJAT-27245 TaxID=1684144 RepID=UPI0006A760AA|nr:hypothetical protein [Bacillus sp. FJAT-27245]